MLAILLGCCISSLSPNIINFEGHNYAAKSQKQNHLTGLVKEKRIISFSNGKIFFYSHSESQRLFDCEIHHTFIVLMMKKWQLYNTINPIVTK